MEDLSDKTITSFYFLSNFLDEIQLKFYDCKQFYCQEMLSIIDF